MPSFLSVATAANVVAMLPTAMGAFAPGSNKNIAVYWGKYICKAHSFMVILT